VSAWDNLCAMQCRVAFSPYYYLRFQHLWTPLVIHSQIMTSIPAQPGAAADVIWANVALNLRETGTHRLTAASASSMAAAAPAAVLRPEFVRRMSGLGPASPDDSISCTRKQTQCKHDACATPICFWGYVAHANVHHILIHSSVT